MNTLDDAELSQRLHDLAEWGRPESVPPLPDAVTVHYLDDARRDRRPVGRVAVLIATAAAVVAALLVTVSRQDHGPVPFVNGTWSTMARAPIPGRAVPATVWTGKEMIVVGGQDMFRTFLSDGAAYNPSTNTWRVLPHAPHQVPGRSAAFWIGGEVIVVPTAAAATVNVGGGVAYPNGPDPRADYAPMALNPDAGTWRSLPQRDGLAQAATEIDGRVLILESDERTVSELDVRTGALRHIGLARQSNWTALGEWQAFAVAGQAVFIALSRGIDQFDAAPWIGIAVDPTTGGISEIRPPKLERPRGASLHTAGAISAPLSSRSLGGVGVASMTPNEKAPFGVRSVRQSFEYDLRDHRWHRLAAAPIFRWDPLGIQLMSFTAVPFGAVLVGKNPGLGEPVPQDPSVHSVYVRDRDQWFELPKPQIDLERVGHVSVWTGRELIVWGGALERGGDPNVADTPTNDGAVYRP